MSPIMPILSFFIMITPPTSLRFIAQCNVFGISDVKVIPQTDLFGDNRLSIEIAGATPADLEKLLS